MGLVVDTDSVEDMLYDLNRDANNKSVYAKQFGMNSLNEQIAQNSIDQAYSQELMNSYQTYLQQVNQSNSIGMIDSLRNEVDKYNYDALEKAYKQSLSQQRSDSFDLYGSYLEAQGIVGDELVELSEAYGKRADSYLDYMKQAQLDDTIADYLNKTGIITEITDEGYVFADDSVIRNKMFASETTYDEDGNVITEKGTLTDEGRAILNMLQSNYTKEDADEQSELSYDAWIENQEQYADDRVDKAVMRQILGIESEYGKQYSKREMLNLSTDYRTAVANNINATLDQSSLTNNTAYQAIISGNDVRITSGDIDGIENQFNQTITDIKSALSEYGFTEQEFNDFLKAEGATYTLDDIGDTSLENMRKYVVTDSEQGTETGMWVEYGLAVTAGTAAAIEAAALYATGHAQMAAAPFTFGATAATAAVTYGFAAAAAATSAAAFILAEEIRQDAVAYGKELDAKVRGMVPYAKELGVYKDDIEAKFNKFIMEAK